MGFRVAWVGEEGVIDGWELAPEGIWRKMLATPLGAALLEVQFNAQWHAYAARVTVRTPAGISAVETDWLDQPTLVAARDACDVFIADLVAEARGDANAAS